MPMSYDIDAERGFVWVRVQGSPDYDEMIACFAAYTGDPAFRRGMGVLVDDRGRTESPPPRDVRRLAQETKESGQKVEGSRCAILVGSETQYGMSRMYELLIEGGPMQTRVFRDESEALAWVLGRTEA